MPESAVSGMLLTRAGIGQARPTLLCYYGHMTSDPYSTALGLAPIYVYIYIRIKKCLACVLSMCEAH